MNTSNPQTVRGYELLERVGAGGFGVVYRAHQAVVGRDVAIKVILPEYTSHPDFIRRFEREAQLIARLEHPYIVPLYDYWREPDGAYLVMRYLRGGSLRAALQGGAWMMDAAVRLLEQIAGALSVAHHQGVIHRDLKPENILLDEQGNAYLSDFGIAKDLLDANQATQASAIAGSPSYISPEQARGETVTPQSDLYSLAVVMYEVLTGEHPFPGLTPATQMLKHLTEPLPSLTQKCPDLPEALGQVIARATEKDGKARYRDVLEFLAAFRQAALGAEVKTGAPTLGSVAPILINPYKGLRSFDESDAADFFGRDALVRQLLERLGEEGPAHRFLAVVGPSGSGKSSVVKAGLIPALRAGALPGSQNWFVVEMLPGAHPLDELEIGLLRIAADKNLGLMEQLQRDERGLIRAARLALPDGSADTQTPTGKEQQSELLLVVDQFEECFTRAVDKAESKHFLRSLWAAVNEPRSRVRVIITLRADFYDRPLMHPEFSQLMRQRTEVVVPLTAEELAEAICKPAERAGVRLEAGLVESIVADIKEQPGALPMLQYALTELFDAQENGLLTKSAYQAIGGVSGALARKAEETFERLDASQQEAARQLFLRLVALGEGTEDTRRRALYSELTTIVIDQTAIQAAMDAFGRTRLLLFDRDPVTRQPSVEVAHEALLREWKRLREWLDESRTDVRMQRLLSTLAQEWAEAQQDPSFLLSGTRLAQFEGWAAGSQIALTQEERAFLDASLAEAQAREAEERARQQRELEAAQKLAQSERQRAEEQGRSARRLRYGAVFLAFLAVVAVILAAVAFQARRTAQAERDKAQVQSAVNQSLLLAARASEANETGDTDLALALALAAVNMEQPPAESVRSLSNIALGPGTRRVLVGHSHEVVSVAFSPDGQSALSGSCKQLDAENQCVEGELFLWNLSTGSITARFSGHAGWVNSVAFSPDGATAISASGDGLVLMWDLATGEILQRFAGHTAGVNSVAFSPDGLSFLSASDDQTLILWDAVTGELIRRFEGHSGAVYQASFSPDGSMAVSASQDTTLILWDVQTGQIIRRLEGHTNIVTDAVFLPDGLSLVSCSWDMSLRLWDVQTGQQLRYQYFPVSMGSLALTPSGHTLIYNQIHELHFWNVDDWASTQQRLLGHASVGIRDIAISPDGQQALTASNDSTLRLWNLEGQAGARRFENDTDSILAVAISPEGQRLFTGSAVGILWDIPSAQEKQRFSGYIGVVSPGAAAFSPDGSQIVASTADFLGTSGATAAILWDAETGQEVCRWEGREHAPRSAVFSPDGRSVLIGYQDFITIYGELILWDAQTCQMVRRFSTEEDITGMAFNAAGNLVLTTSAFFSNVILWDVASGQEIRRYQLEAVPLFDVAFGPGEATVLAAVADGTLTEWDLETGSLIRRFRGHESSVWSLDISRDGRYVVSSSEVGEVILWNYETGQEIRRFRGHLSFVGSVVFSPDGRFAYSAAADGSIFEWPVGDLPLEDLIAWVQDNRYLRELTCEERALYQVEPLCPEAAP